MVIASALHSCDQHIHRSKNMKLRFDYAIKSKNNMHTVNSAAFLTVFDNQKNCNPVEMANSFCDYFTGPNPAKKIPSPA